MQYPCTQTPFYRMCGKNEPILSRAVRGNGSGRMYDIQETERQTHEGQCLTITSSQGLEQWNCVDATFVCERSGYQPLKQAIQDQASSSPVPRVYCLLTLCLPDVKPRSQALVAQCHAHNQHFQCDFSSCEAMKQVCYVYIVMVTGAALPLKRVQCH